MKKKQKLYLEKYFEQNNEVKDRLEINRKMLVVFIGFILCTIIYLACITFPIHRFQGDLSTIEVIKYYKIIMNVTYLISLLGIILIIVNHFKPNQVRYQIKKSLYSILDWVIILPICVVISTILFTFVFTVTEVSGSSMMPTIEDGEHLVLLFDTNLERNDIVVISVSKDHNLYVDSNKNYLKRIIGMPGDEMKVFLEDGQTVLYINNEKYDQSQYDILCKGGVLPTIEASGSGGTITTIIKEERCFIIGDDGTVMFAYLDFSGDAQYTTVIPQDYYFVLGDNRDGSNDSRGIGLIRHEDVIGTVRYRTSKKFIFIWERI